MELEVVVVVLEFSDVRGSFGAGGQLTRVYTTSTSVASCSSSSIWGGCL